MNLTDIPNEQTTLWALHEKFARVDPNWNRRPPHLESKEAARARIISSVAYAPNPTPPQHLDHSACSYD